MMRIVSLLLLFFLGGISASFAQKIYEEAQIEVNGKKKNVFLIHEVKTNKEGIKELRIRFKNNTKANVNVSATINIYDNGVLAESSEISDCLKKSKADNVSRPTQIVSSEVFQNEGFKVEVEDYKLEVTDECRETDSE